MFEAREVQADVRYVRGIESPLFGKCCRRHNNLTCEYHYTEHPLLKMTKRDQELALREREKALANLSHESKPASMSELRFQTILPLRDQRSGGGTASPDFLPAPVAVGAVTLPGPSPGTLRCSSSCEGRAIGGARSFELRNPRVSVDGFPFRRPRTALFGGF